MTSDFGEDGYVVCHGDGRFVAWEASDAGSSWTSATVAMLDLVNTLLTAHGSDERAWALMGGNDLFVVFATEAACRFINSTLGSSEQLHDGTKG